MHRFIRIALGLSLLTLIAAGRPGTSAAVTTAAQPATISFWGMNAYLTKNERVGRDDIALLARKARDAGVRWTREELPWAYIEDSQGRYRRDYDSRIGQVAAQGLGIVGMLLTTPTWARESSCSGSYWCPPTTEHIPSFANFAAWMVERYDGDGNADALGSPRVAYWEIWNEPNDTALWPDIGTAGVTRKQRYGDLLVAAYRAIKNADPTAKVLIGGMYVFDTISNITPEDGIVFLTGSNGVFEQVPAARNAWDVFSLHPYMPDRRPEAPEVHQSLPIEGRIKNTRAALDDPARGGRLDKPPIWVTEMGWCTVTTPLCGRSWTEDQQADFLSRSLVIAQQSGVEHVSWFQLEDAFNRPDEAFNSMALLRDLSGGDYSAKPAYHAYATLAHQLAGAIPIGVGPVHTHVYDPRADRGSENEIYDYRYTRDTTTIDVLWRTTGSSTMTFPVQAGEQVVQVGLNGVETPLAPQGGTVTLSLSETPVIIVQRDTVALQAGPSIVILARAGTASASATLRILSSGSGTLQWQIVAKDAWIAVDRSSGSTPDAIRVTANTDRRQAGSYTGSITLRAGGVSDLQVPVTLVIADRLYKVSLPAVQR